eukprot:1152200-Pelagomonas_calceolata.AAC.1
MVQIECASWPPGLRVMPAGLHALNATKRSSMQRKPASLHRHANILEKTGRKGNKNHVCSRTGLELRNNGGEEDVWV